MKHQYNLKELPFSWIKDWIKKIEIRLFDEKRQNIKLLDQIEFSNEALWNLTKTVVWLHYHTTINDLIDSYDINLFGKTNKEDIIKRIHTYYSQEDQEKYWFLAIVIN